MDLRAWQCSGGNSGVYIGGVISSEVSALLCSLCLARTSSCLCGTALCLFKTASMKSFAAFLFNKNMRVAAMRRTYGSRGRFFAGQGNEGHAWKTIGPRRALLCEELPHNAQPCGLRHLRNHTRHQRMGRLRRVRRYGSGVRVRGRAPTRASALELCVTVDIESTFGCYPS